MRATVAQGVSASREVETRVRLQEEKVKEVKGSVEEMSKWTQDTDRYLALYEPIRNFSLVADFLNHTLEGSLFNRSIKY